MCTLLPGTKWYSYFCVQNIIPFGESCMVRFINSSLKKIQCFEIKHFYKIKKMFSCSTFHKVHIAWRDNMPNVIHGPRACEKTSAFICAADFLQALFTPRMNFFYVLFRLMYVKLWVYLRFFFTCACIQNFFFFFVL